MARITKSEIESRLLVGAAIAWADASHKQQKLQLSDAKQRRLFAFLLGSSVRKPTELPQQFIDDLATAFDAAEDPASAKSEVLLASADGTWRLHSIETEGFGGLNTWSGSPFRHEFEGESLLLEGPNGSGKSSLTGAIVWALESLRSAGHAAARTFDDNATAILTALERATPSALRGLSEASLKKEPRTELLHQVRTRFVLNERFSSSLTGLTKLSRRHYLLRLIALYPKKLSRQVSMIFCCRSSACGSSPPNGCSLYTTGFQRAKKIGKNGGITLRLSLFWTSS
jgi:hypothetical protein